MTTTVTKGYTDTPIDGVTELTFGRALLNIDKDFRIKSNDAGKEVVLTNLTSPIDRPERIRIAYSEVANVYTGTGIDPSVSLPTKRGVSVLVQLTNILTITDSTDASYRRDLPISLHAVIKVPASEFITAAVVEENLGRLLSGLFDTGSTSTSRLESILRGSLVPSEL